MSGRAIVDGRSRGIIQEKFFKASLRFCGILAKIFASPDYTLLEFVCRKVVGTEGCHAGAHYVH